MLAGTEAEAGEQIHAQRRVREMNLELLGRNRHGKKRMNELATTQCSSCPIAVFCNLYYLVILCIWYMCVSTGAGRGQRW